MVNKKINTKDVLHWVKNHPIATQGEMKREFTIDGIQPASYIGREQQRGGITFTRTQVPNKFGGKPFKYVYNTNELVTYALANNHGFAKSKERIDKENEIAEEQFITERHVAINNGKHALGSALIPNEIRAKRFLTRREILAGANQFTPPCGVYFLIDGNDIVYVGQSTSVTSRIQNHLNDRHKEFNSYAWIPCPREALDVVESIYILMYMPKYNERADGRMPAMPLSYKNLIDGNILKEEYSNDRYRTNSDGRKIKD